MLSFSAVAAEVMFSRDLLRGPSWTTRQRKPSLLQRQQQGLLHDRLGDTEGDQSDECDV